MKRLTLILALLVGCKPNNVAPTVDASVPAPSASVAVVVDAGAPRDAGAALTQERQLMMLHLLKNGRTFSRAKNWPEAISAFEGALAISPDDAACLSELGWAEFNANDLDKAEAANSHALANAKTPALRAPILYNVGRVAEARGDKVAAIRAYRQSLTLRANSEVKKRLTALGTDGGVDPDDELADSTCGKPFSGIAAVCTCLQAKPESRLIYMPEGVTPLCQQDMIRTPLGDPRVSTLTFGTPPTEPGETMHYVTVRETDQTRLLTLLGTDYDPGAAGVHDSLHVLGGSSRNVGGHVIVVFKTKRDDNNLNWAGLENCFDHATQETVCAISDDHGGSKCTPEIPIAEEAGCVVTQGLKDSDFDESTRQMIAEIKKNSSTSSVKTAWTIAEDGTVTVTVKEGSRDLVSASILQPHKLF